MSCRAHSTTENPFVSLLIPVAIQSSKASDAILALAAAHRCAMQPQLQVAAFTHYAVAVRGVKYSLAQWQSFDNGALVELLTTVVLLCMFEVRLILQHTVMNYVCLGT